MQNQEQTQVRYITDAQINKLRELGYTGPVTNMTMAWASIKIKELIQQNAQNQQQAQSQPQPQASYGTYNPQPQQPPVQQPAPQQSYQQNNYQQQNQMQTYKHNEVADVSKIGINPDELMNNLMKLANDGELFIPENYPVGNTIKSAISKIITSDQADKLLACTPESKKQALTEYVIQGLDASKTQAYFIPYGNKMTMMRSYFGDATVVKRTGLVKDIYAVVIYEGDEIEIGFDEYGRKTLIKHVTKFENQDNEIIGAYAVAIGVNGYKCYEFMTRKEINTSWKMSKMQNGKLLTDYKQEASKRTVIRRLVKMIFNTSINTTKEQTALIGSYNRTTEDEYIDTEITTDAINEEQKTKTGSKKININDTPMMEE